MATIMEKLQALLDEQGAERDLEEAHARRMFNLSARTTISVQQLDAAIREYQKARAKARKRKQQLEALGRRRSTRTSKAPDRLIANAIDLRPSTLVNQGEELEHYYKNEQIGELVAQVLRSDNIYK